MIRNYLKSAVRNIKRQPFISFINIFGLTVGLACCLLISAYVINEKSYDKFNTNVDDIYRVTRTFYSVDGAVNLRTGSVAPPFAPLLQNAFPDIKAATRVFQQDAVSFKYGDKLLNEKDAFFADQNLFTVFTIPVLMGDPATALKEPYSVMLTEEVAKRYFNGADPMNKTLILGNNKHPYKITGIFKPLPANAHLHPQVLMSLNTLKDPGVYGEEALTTKYNHNAFYTYLLLPKNYNVSLIERQLPDFLDKYVHLSRLPGTMKTHQATSLSLQKLADIHLHSHLDREAEQNGDIKRVYIFSAIALFILLIACINYMNLSTARSVLRAREIGVRKVIGAQRREIIAQFLSESVLVTCIALVLAMLAVTLAIPFINKVANQQLSVQLLLQWKVLVPVLILPFVIGLLSGAYPALFISSFIPVKALKGMMSFGKGSLSFRKILVVLQFSVSIILIVATTVVYQQLNYMQDKDLGFNKDHVLIVKYGPDMLTQYKPFKADLLSNSTIKSVGKSSYVPSERVLSASDASAMHNGVMERVKISLNFLNADYDFIPTYGMKMAAGRNFSREFGTDTSNFILNEAAVKALEWKDPSEAIGQDFSYGEVRGKIIGVVKDVQFESLHQKVIPLLFQLPRFDYFGSVSIKIDGRHINSAVATVQNTWKKYQPNVPFEYSFLDDKFGQLYNSEQQQGNLFTIFSCIAIFIACLGLFGLSAFTISQRIKEVGVRKVLGASVPQIVKELSTDFLKLVLIAALIAGPIAWYAMNKWLVDFAYRIEISWWILALAGALALIIAFATISFQSVKAALMNPVKSLRSE